MQIKRIIPNSLTCANLLCGSVSVFMATQEQFLWAFAFIIAGAIFDFFDGASARWLKVPSPLGVQLDSLADDITFGLAPAMALMCYLKPIIGWWALIALLIAAFSALRLAKFNIDERQATSFIGLATPANAIFWLGTAYAYQSLLATISPWCILGAVLLSSYLLVCELPMFSFKFHNFRWADNRIRYIFLIGAIVFAVCLFRQSLPIIILWYILLSIVGVIAVKRK